MIFKSWPLDVLEWIKALAWERTRVLWAWELILHFWKLLHNSLIMISGWKRWLAVSLARDINSETLIITAITTIFKSKFKNSLKLLSLRFFIFFTQTSKILVYSWSSCFTDQESSIVWCNSSRFRAIMCIIMAMEFGNWGVFKRFQPFLFA